MQPRECNQAGDSFTSGAEIGTTVATDRQQAGDDTARDHAGATRSLFKLRGRSLNNGGAYSRLLT